MVVTPTMEMLSEPVKFRYPSEVMGLREKKVARTREHIVDVAIDLFIAQGYDQTTMEQIAETADVGPSTLYRYFSSKDLLILDRLVTFVDLGRALQARPLGEPVEVSLTAVVSDALGSFVDDPRNAALRQVIDESPAPRARLWDVSDEARSNLEQALAERMALSADDLSVTLTARTALMAYGVAAERWWSGDRSTPQVDVLNGVLKVLARQDVILPKPLDDR